MENQKNNQIVITSAISYLHLAIGLIVILLNSLISADSSVLNPTITIVGSIFIMGAFGSFANSNYRNTPSKTFYKIVRYIIAGLLFITTIAQIYSLIASIYTHYSQYFFVVDASLITYLLTYKPSNTSIAMKILKVVGYSAILIGINTLQFVVKTINYIYYTETYINWGTFYGSAFVMVIGFIFIYLSHRNA